MDIYKRCLLLFPAGALFFLLVVQPLLFWLNLGVPTEQERYLDEWWQKKETYARSITGRKILFVSGSNTLFGVNTARIEEELGIPTVNFGLHAGLSFYILHRAAASMQPGDIVVLPLEYPIYTWHKYEWDETYLTYLTAYDKAAYMALSWPEKIAFIYRCNPLDLLWGVKCRLVPPARRTGSYDSKYLNQNGDMLNNLAAKSQSPGVLKSKIVARVFKETPIPTEDAKEEFGSFFAFCREQHITVYVTWPNYLWKDKAFHDQDLTAIEGIKTFYQAQGVEVLGEYTDCLYEAENFYDTLYHLNSVGKEKHTDYLISLLKGKV
ncbi:MAG: hypothetical protein IJ849_12660 [Selenomonadaceae bacterium]|nr:hypothetical protein [Selenomonadaceae bacterium]